MALHSPPSKENPDIQFKLHDKIQIFDSIGCLKNNLNLLAVSATHGLLFAGDPNAPILKVFILNDLVSSKSEGNNVLVRTVQLAGDPSVIACSCDGTMVAVSYTNNNCEYLQIFSVSSFLKQNIETLYSFPIASEVNVSALQLLWNPVISGSLGIVASNGGFSLYTLKGNGQYELHSLDKSQQVQCGCWSPKGKQIVLGFQNGKFQQFKPDLTPAKTIVCPANVHPGPFNTIAIQWLSTYQFAASFLQCGENMVPSLYIVNAPKGGQPSYINYYDVCYSTDGPRDQQTIFTYIQQWNLLLVASANGIEVGVLGCRGTGDTPEWVQYSMLDEARIEMPLTEANDETYPIGFAYDTSSSHNIVIGDNELPTMPMLHIMSTHGKLISFNFLNLAPDAVGVCSPPPPIANVPPGFQPLEIDNVSVTASGTSAEYSEQPAPAINSGNKPKIAETNIDNRQIEAQQPTKPSIFGDSNSNSSSNNQNLFSTSNVLGGGLSFGSLGTESSGFGSLPAASALPSFGLVKSQVDQQQMKQQQQQQQQQQVQQVPPQQQTSAVNANVKPKELSKPLYTVPPTFAPPPPQQAVQPTQETSIARKQLNSSEVEIGFLELINIDMNTFEKELQSLAKKLEKLFKNIGNPEEMKDFSKRLNDLQDIIDQANDRDFELDVKDLRVSITECRSMMAECRWKLKRFENPDLPRLSSSLASDSVNERHLTRLQSYLNANRVQMQNLQQQIDAQWSDFQDTIRRNTKSSMHIPCLDGIYQRMSKLKEKITRHRTKLNYIKSKLKENGLILNGGLSRPNLGFNNSNAANKTIESLADSVLSMSLIHVVAENRSKLSDDKLNAIRNFTRQRQKINIIKPQRPDRAGLKSEVVIETYLRSERKKQIEAAKPTISTPSTATSKTPSSVGLLQAPAAKPTPISFSTPQTKEITSAVPKPMVSATAPFAGVASKPLATATSIAAFAKSVEGTTKPAFSFSQTGFSGFANLSQQPLNFGPPKTSTESILKFSSPNPVTTTTAPVQTPISFAAKVIGGETTKASTPLSPSNTLNASPFAGFGTTPSKPLADKTDKENKKVDEPLKSFNFNANPTSLTSFGSTAPKPMQQPSQATALSKPANNENKPNAGLANFGSALTSSNTNTGLGKTDSSLVSSTQNSGSDKQPFGIPGSGALTRAPSGFFSGFGKSLGDTISTSSASPDQGNLTFQTISSVGGSAASAKPEDSKSQVTSEKAASANQENKPDSVFGNLNICKPNTAAPDTKPPANVFSGLATSQPIDFSFTSTTLTGSTGVLKSETTPATGFTFGVAAKPTSATTTPLITVPTITPSATSAPTATVTKPATTPAAVVEAKPTGESAVPKSTLPTMTPSDTVTTTIANETSTTTSPADFKFTLSGLGSTAPAPPNVQASMAASIFGSTNVSTSSTASIFGGGGVATTPATTSASSVFGGTGFGAGTAAPTTGASIFGTSSPLTAATATTSAPSFFGTSISTVPASTAVSTSPFGSAGVTVTAPPNANLFSALPKPDQSVFGSPAATSAPSGGSIFAAATATTAPANTSPFGGATTNPPAGGSSIFGGGATSPTAFNKPIFGGTAATSPFGGSSIFGGAAKQPENTTNIFGGAPAGGEQATSVFGSPTGQVAPSTGSIFGQSTLAQQQQSPFGGSGTGSTGTSIFGSAANNSNQGSIFGGAASPPALAPSAFGANASTGNTPGGGFGGFSQSNAGSAFGSPSGGSFAQGGASVAATGFGSPQASAFTKPVFGAAPAFGGQPTFGAQPTFGGAATFGSPKGFGSFAGAVSPTTSPTSGNMFGQAVQKNNLFESLGSSDTGLSFGNLAQSANANAQKSAFGGTSFTSYRA